MTQGQSMSIVAQAARRTAGEHEKVRRLLALVEAAFGKGQPLVPSGPDVVAARLDALRGTLRAHFDEEERTGLLERIERRGPEAAEHAAALRGEHEVLLDQLDTLRAVPPLDRRRPPWLRDVRRLLEDLSAHEQREGALLDEAASH